MAPDDRKPAAGKVLATNRKAFRDYFVLEKIEAGIELRGAEVKSLREGRFSLAEGFASIPVTSEAQDLTLKARVVSAAPRATCGANS